jgi:hypothetical protein
MPLTDYARDLAGWSRNDYGIVRLVQGSAGADRLMLMREEYL